MLLRAMVTMCVCVWGAWGGTRDGRVIRSGYVCVNCEGCKYNDYGWAHSMRCGYGLGVCGLGTQGLVGRGGLFGTFGGGFGCC